jgi:hypothetical protein
MSCSLVEVQHHISYSVLTSSILLFLLLWPPQIPPLSTPSPYFLYLTPCSWIHFFPSFYISFCLIPVLCSGAWATLIPFTVITISIITVVCRIGTHMLTPLFSAVVTRTHAGSCWLKRAACDEPLMWTWSEPIAWGTRWMVVALLCGSFEHRFAILPVR